MTHQVRLAVTGAGLIGKRHIEAIAQTDEAVLAAVVDPDEAAKTYARSLQVPWFRELAHLLEADTPDGVILATPNQVHVEHGLACVRAGVPVLVEKPIGTDVRSAATLVEAAEAAGVPLLVGHHRRHNPLIQAARQALRDGAIGDIIVVHATCWFFKPADYFAVEWRRRPGAGPVFLNLIHDVDLLRHLCGEVAWVQALESNAVRGNAVEETAAALLRFHNGALGTLGVSDTVVSPWSWELTARENPAYPPNGQSCYLIGGTHGALEVPALRIWRNAGARSWLEPLAQVPVACVHEDPLIRQIRQLSRVICAHEAPLVSGRDGLETLRVIEAIKQSARSGQSVVLLPAGGDETL